MFGLQVVGPHHYFFRGAGGGGGEEEEVYLQRRGCEFVGPTMYMDGSGIILGLIITLAIDNLGTYNLFL